MADNAKPWVDLNRCAADVAMPAQHACADCQPSARMRDITSAGILSAAITQAAMTEAFTSSVAAAGSPWGDPWSVLLRQPCVTSNPAVYCKLLCCSKEISQTLIELNAGQLQLHVTASDYNRAEELAGWLQKHATLLAELHVLSWQGDSFLWDGGRSAIKFINAALQQAAGTAAGLRPAGVSVYGEVAPWGAASRAAPAVREAAAVAAPLGYLPLRSLRHAGCGSTDCAVLQCLSPSSLTDLDLRVAELPAAGQLLSSLCSLTNLQSLALDVSAVGATADTKQQLNMGNRTMSVIGGLSQLKQLSLEVAAVSTSDLHLLPVGVQNLQLCCRCTLRRDEQQPALQLQQLSRLTTLALTVAFSSSSQQQFELQAGDALPLQLQQFEVTLVQQVEPLLQLQQLRELNVCHCTLDAAEMQQLTALASLTALRLWYGITADGEDEHTTWTGGSNSCCIWQQLPLVGLELSMDVIGRHALQALGLATKLSHLHISFCTVKATEQELADQLSMLQSLRQLWFDDFVFDPPPHVGVPFGRLQALAAQDGVGSFDYAANVVQQLQGLETLSLQPMGVPAEAGCALLAAAARLPVLNNLSLYGAMWVAAAMLELQVATQLTQLAISQCGEREGIGDDMAACLISCLTGLRDLELNSPALTEACLPALNSLQHITRVSLNDSHQDRFAYQMILADGV
jgi:hypothetical protein